jgi:hypothetical protein
MPIIQPPPAPPKKETIAIRLDTQILEELRRYAACVPTKNLSHIIAGALRRLFNDDGDYKTWRDSHPELLATTKSRRDGATTSKHKTSHPTPPSSGTSTPSARQVESRNSVGGE